MFTTHSYTQELEYLIKDILLPVYTQHFKSLGKQPDYSSFPKSLLTKPRKTCALCKPYGQF